MPMVLAALPVMVKYMVSVESLALVKGVAVSLCYPLFYVVNVVGATQSASPLR